jgi:hypothetical protein
LRNSWGVQYIGHLFGYNNIEVCGEWI